MALILVVPILALLLFAGVRINDTRLDAQEAENLNAFGKFSGLITQLVHHVSIEREGAVSLLATNTTWEDAGLDARVAETDDAIDALRNDADSLSLDGRKELSNTLNTALDTLTTLPDLRTRMQEQRIATEDAVFRYGSVIENLLNVVDTISQIPRDTHVASHLRALAVFSHYKEATAQESRVLTTALTEGRFAPGQYRVFVSTLAEQETYMKLFLTVAPQEEIEVFNRELSSESLTEITDLETTAARTEGSQNINVEVDAWTSAADKRASAISTVEVHISESVGNATAELRDDAIQASLIEAAIVLIALVTAITVSLLIARSMVRQLVQLRTSALEVANTKLPEAVQQLQHIDTAPHSTSEERRVDEILSRALPQPRPESDTNDEIGQTSRAFDAVHAEAVYTATEQARLRRSVSGMFVNLARRSQLLVEKLITRLDALEQGEEDPDRLSELFTLDHLANRMRRNDENLMILAGAEGGKRWDEDVPLIDVLRAATSEVEQYTRINVNYVDAVEVRASVVRDLAHLIAELAENATSFSSPNTTVEMGARLINDQVVIEIEDHGIGMSAELLEEMNAKLSKPPTLDINISRMMGLFVVARLSHKQGIRVMLNPSGTGGVLAIVALPSSTIITPEPVQRPQETALIPQQRSGFEHSGEHQPLAEGAQQSTAGAESIPETPAPSAWRYNAASGENTMETPLPIFDQIESEWFRPPTQLDDGFNSPPEEPASQEYPSAKHSVQEYSSAVTEQVVEATESTETATPSPAPLPSPTTAPSPPPESVSSASSPEEEKHSTIDLSVVAENMRAQESEVPNPTPPSHEPVDPVPLPGDAARSAEPRNTWETPADAGWKRAQELQEPTTGSLTTAGLPKRVPQANYVPGSVADSLPQRGDATEVKRKPASHRSPDAVRGLLSSYRRGMEQGRHEATGPSTHNAVTDERATEEQ